MGRGAADYRLPRRARGAPARPKDGCRHSRARAARTHCWRRRAASPPTDRRPAARTAVLTDVVAAATPPATRPSAAVAPLTTVTLRLAAPRTSFAARRPRPWRRRGGGGGVGGTSETNHGNCDDVAARRIVAPFVGEDRRGRKTPTKGRDGERRPVRTGARAQARPAAAGHGCALQSWVIGTLGTRTLQELARGAKGRRLAQPSGADGRRHLTKLAFNQHGLANGIASFQSHQAPGCRVRRLPWPLSLLSDKLPSQLITPVPSPLAL